MGARSVTRLVVYLGACRSAQDQGLTNWAGASRAHSCTRGAVTVALIASIAIYVHLERGSGANEYFVRFWPGNNRNDESWHLIYRYFCRIRPYHCCESFLVPCAKVAPCRSFGLRHMSATKHV